MSESRGFIDFAAVKAAVPLEKILTHYGFLESLSPHGAGLRGCCPIHKGDNPKEFSVSLEKNAWNCFSQCQHGGNQLELVVVMEGCTLNEAAWKVNDWFDVGQEKKVREKTRPARAKASGTKREKTPPAVETEATAIAGTPPAAVPTPKPKPKSEPTADNPEPAEETGENAVLTFQLEHLDSAHPYLAERGLSPETIAHFGIGYCPRGIMAGRIAIPIHNTAGQIVGNAGRWPGEPPEGKDKYRLPGKFRKTLEVFNLHRAALESDDTPLVIVEGFFPVMHLWQHGIRRVVSLMGWFLSERQESTIASILGADSRVLLMLDNDEAGIAAQEKIAPRLARHAWVHCYRWPAGITQPDALTPEHLAAWRP